MRQVHSLKAAGFDPVTYDQVSVEPTSTSFMDAARFVEKEGPFAALCSLGGGSSMDTAKAAILYACHPPPQVCIVRRRCSKPSLGGSIWGCARLLGLFLVCGLVLVYLGIHQILHRAITYLMQKPGIDPFLHYVNAPVGSGAAVPPLGLIPHIAIPSTAGTGSEATGFAICKLEV